MKPFTVSISETGMFYRLFGPCQNKILLKNIETEKEQCEYGNSNSEPT